MPEKDLYQILEVDRKASKEEIKKAFRKKAHQYHPDKKDGDERKFKEINAAYQILNDDKKRAQYDQYGAAAFQQGANGFDWSDFSKGFSGNMSGFDFSDLGDIMGDLFGGRGRTRAGGPRRGQDIEIHFNLTFEQAAFGTSKEVNIPRQEKCQHCKGNQAEPGSKIDTCKTCEGRGQVRKVQQTFLGHIQTTTVCHTCQGKGQIPEKLCTKCAGKGINLIDDKINIKVPAGIDHNQAIKIPDKGHAGTGGGPMGDLYVVFSVQEHKDFVRDGYDIHTTAQLPFTLAALGGKIKVKTLEGEVILKIPAGTEHGHRFSLKDKGVSKLHGSGRGDHIVEVLIKIPKKLSKKQRELLESFAKESGDLDVDSGGFWKSIF